MGSVVIVDFPAAEGQKDALVTFLAVALRDTRKYDGCLEAYLCEDEDNEQVVSVIERWENVDKYALYDAWRTRTGFVEAISPMLGGILVERRLLELGR